MTSLGLMALLLFLFLSWGLSAYIFTATCPFQLKAPQLLFEREKKTKGSMPFSSEESIGLRR